MHLRFWITIPVIKLSAPQPPSTGKMRSFSRKLYPSVYLFKIRLEYASDEYDRVNPDTLSEP